MKITSVTVSMGRREHLETTLPLMLEEFDHCIVVDWSCPQGSGEWAAKEGAEVIFRKNEKFFDLCQARNLGARAVKDRTVCFIDADTMVMTGLKEEIESLLTLQTMVVAARTAKNIDVPNLCGFIALDIGQFWGVGGYCEEIQGYGLEDFHLRTKLRLERDMQLKRLSAGALGALRHSNELRGRYHEKPIEVSAKVNHDFLISYLAKHGISDWIHDPKTADLAYIQA
jgi:glycosyltransferase involved in cell wall biosynthesis